VLAKLHHHNIVAHRRTLSVAGRTALLLKSAGDKTLAETLKEEGPPVAGHAAALRRRADRSGEPPRSRRRGPPRHQAREHRHRRNRTGKLQLVLFDFSLCRTPADNITAGTHPYLDPFLSLRRPPRWDLYAERFALAVTLYEMAVGQPPVWGDGQSSPAMLDVEATIESDVFDPVTREGFTAFFAKALKRDYRQRFDNAEDMLRAWRAIFAARRPCTRARGAPRALPPSRMTATALTTMAELGYSLEAQDVLERMGIHNARELLAVDRIRFRYLRGVGDKIRKEIRLKAKELARLRPDLTQGRSTCARRGRGGRRRRRQRQRAGRAAAAAPPRRRRPAGGSRPGPLPGLDDSGASRHLAHPGRRRPSQSGGPQHAHRRAHQGPRALAARTRLHRAAPAARHAAAQPGPGDERCTRARMALLALRGCAEQDDAERLRQASAVLRAAVEAESHLDQPRFEAFDHARSR
jgi:hypothetical protein